MFAKKPLPEPKPLGLPLILRINGPHIALEQAPSGHIAITPTRHGEKIALRMEAVSRGGLGAGDRRARG